MEPKIHPVRNWNALGALLVAVLVTVMVFILAPKVLDQTQIVDDPYSLPSGQTIELIIGKKKLAALQQRRDQALKVGILIEDDSSEVKAKLREGDRQWEVKLRLKGDWTDHLEGEHWSFRIEIKDSLPWRRLRVFSLQRPERRGYANEWLIHRVLAREGLLTTYYEFIRLRLNGRDLGVYAIEEHFSKELMERQQRREGPILKLDESGMWDARVASIADGSFPYLQIPFFEAAPVRPFQKGHVLKDSSLQVQFQNAQRLMLQYREGLQWRDKTYDDSINFVTNSTLPVKFRQVFDVELAAKQYALIDLFGAYHSLIWHNRRYYFNPITQKLEPVVFDCFSGPTNDTYIRYPFWGYEIHGQSRDDAAYRDITSVFVFQDPDFLRAYYRELERYTSAAFMDSVLRDLDAEIKAIESQLGENYWGYSFDHQPIVGNATAIREVLVHGLDPKLLLVKPSNAFNCYGQCLEVRNLNPMPVELWVEGEDVSTAQLLEANCGQPRQSMAYLDVAKGKRIFYRLPGCLRRGELLVNSEQ